MDYTFWIGLVGSLILVTGAAWPEPKKVTRSVQSLKNWLFCIGSFFMFVYSILGYTQGGSVFFVFLEVLVVLATVLMMLDAPDRIDTPIIGSITAILVVWSFFLFENLHTLFIIIGLSVISLGYALEMGTVRRSLALTLGSAFIALFSFIEASWIFFWLNVFFALFSGYYVIRKAGRCLR